MLTTSPIKTLFFVSISLPHFKFVFNTMLVNYPSKTSIYHIPLFIKIFQKISHYFFLLSFLPSTVGKFVPSK